MQDALLHLLTGKVIAPLISSGEVQRATYSFNLIFNFEWVPTSHCFQWEMNKCLSILSE